MQARNPTPTPPQTHIEYTTTSITLPCPMRLVQPTVCLEGYAECNPWPARCLPGYGFDGGVKGTCQLCRVGRYSTGGTPEKPISDCIGCPASFSTTFKGATSGANCTGEEAVALVVVYAVHAACHWCDITACRSVSP